jgi:hypothetical protein
MTLKVFRKKLVKSIAHIIENPGEYINENLGINKAKS